MGRQRSIRISSDARLSPTTGFVCLVWLAAVILCTTALSARTQNRKPFSIHIKSNLVLVPVFVYDRSRLDDPPPWSCVDTDEAIFRKLLPFQPFLPRDCDAADIRGLDASDFRVFLGGIRAKIRGLTAQAWRITARDNMGKHREFTQTPTGIWSTTDLGQGFWSTSDAPFYLLAVAPPASLAAGCSKIRVTVDRRHALVLARRKYCVGQTAANPLVGTSLGKQMERDLASPKTGGIPLSLQAGFFYYSAKTKARIEVALDFPWNPLAHKWQYGEFHATIGVLGTAHSDGATLAVRFSDLACCSPNSPVYFRGGWHNGLSAGGALPARYERQLDLPPGHYNLRVVLSDGTKFGRAETALDIPAYHGKTLALSSVLLCKRYRPAHAAAVERAAAHFAPQYVPLVSQGIQFTPAGNTDFKHGEPMVAYFEAYEPLLATQPKTEVEADIKIVNRTTGQVVKNFPSVNVAPYVQPGSTAIHIARKIPFGELPPGAYRLEVRATDSAGQSTPWQTADFTIEKGRWEHESLQLIK